jgi:hypothetical protein
MTVRMETICQTNLAAVSNYRFIYVFMFLQNYNLPVFLYGCEILSLTLREEHRLKVFENRVLRRIFGPRRDEVTGDWMKLHNEELHNMYSSPNKSRRMRWAGHVARMGDGECI